MNNSKNYLKSIINTDLLDSILIPSYNLSAILGDYESMMTTGNLVYALSGYTMLSSGVYVQEDSKDSLFNTQVSDKSTVLYPLIKARSSSIVSKINSPSITSPLILYSHQLTDANLGKCNVIYLETFSIYLELLSCTPSSGMSKVTVNDLLRIDGNIRLISSSLSSYPSPPIELLKVLHDLQRTISFIARQDHLFNSTYSGNLQDYRSLIGGDVT